jgi:hypothetical protein
MLKKTLVLLMLGAAFSTQAWAHDRGYVYGRVIRVEPAILSGFDDGRSHFEILYQLGGARYWASTDYDPGPWIAVPQPTVVYTRRVYAPPRYYATPPAYVYGYRGHDQCDHGRRHERKHWAERHGDDD